MTWWLPWLNFLTARNSLINVYQTIFWYFEKPRRGDLSKLVNKRPLWSNFETCYQKSTDFSNCIIELFDRTVFGTSRFYIFVFSPCTIYLNNGSYVINSWYLTLTKIDFEYFWSFWPSRPFVHFDHFGNFGPFLSTLVNLSILSVLSFWYYWSRF